MRATAHPCNYQVFARFWLDELSRAAGKRVTFATVPDAAVDRLAALGIDYLYLTGVWTTGAEGRRISREHEPFWRDYDHALPGWTPDDVVGSPFAVARYSVDPLFGGDAALAVLRRRLASKHVGLLLDFVPNHVARDHPWIDERPELFLRDAEGRVLPGRDPYYPPWPDTAQLDYRKRETRAACIEALESVVSRCDGVRCDMAMLLVESVFRRTWAEAPPPPPADEASGEVWADAIDAVRRKRHDFLFIAEVYWDLEWRLQMLGFDYTYDKTLYDRLLHASAASIRDHLGAAGDYQRRSVRFIENHDEPRAAALFAPDRHRAAAVIASTVPGMRFFHDGQLEGRKVRANVHLSRRAEEAPDAAIAAFYESLLGVLRGPALRTGSFAQLTPRDAAAGAAGPDAFLAHRWDSPRGAVVVIVNYAPRRGQCRVALDLPGTAGRRLRLVDRLTGESFERDGDELLDPTRGLYVDLPAYGVHLLEVQGARRNGR